MPDSCACLQYRKSIPICTGFLRVENQFWCRKEPDKLSKQCSRATGEILHCICRRRTEFTAFGDDKQDFKPSLYSSDSGLPSSLNWLLTGAEILALRALVCHALQEAFGQTAFIFLMPPPERTSPTSYLNEHKVSWEQLKTFKVQQNYFNTIAMP